MKKYTTYLSSLMVLGVLLASCGSMQPVSQVRDDAYFMPSEEPVAPPLAENSRMEQPEQMAPVEDYFDAGTSKELGSSRGYYDMAYNDPYYYNYGRFGLNSGPGMGGMSMGYMSGWNSPSWSMGLGWGSSYGWGPSYGANMHMGWGNPYGQGWYDPWDPWNRWSSWNNPYWPGMGYNPYNMGYGGGPYYGPYGYGTDFYAPVVVGGSSNVYVGHRSSLGAGGGETRPGGAGGARPSGMVLRDPVSLDPVRREAASPRSSGTDRQERSILQQSRSLPRTTTPGSINRNEQSPRSTPQLDRREQPRTAPSRTSPSRTAPDRQTAPRNFEPQQRSGGSDRGSSPSRSPSDGGSRPSGPPRPR